MQFIPFCSKFELDATGRLLRTLSTRYYWLTIVVVIWFTSEVVVDAVSAGAVPICWIYCANLLSSVWTDEQSRDGASGLSVIIHVNCIDETLESKVFSFVVCTNSAPIGLNNALLRILAALNCWFIKVCYTFFSAVFLGIWWESSYFLHLNLRLFINKTRLEMWLLINNRSDASYGVRRGLVIGISTIIALESPNANLIVMKGFFLLFFEIFM